MRVSERHDKHNDYTVQIGNRSPEADQRIHIRHAFEQRPDPAFKERDVDKEDGRGKNELQERKIFGVLVHIQKIRQRQPPPYDAA